MVAGCGWILTNISPRSEASERAPKLRKLLEIARNERIGPRALSGYPGIRLGPPGVRPRLSESRVVNRRFSDKNQGNSAHSGSCALGEMANRNFCQPSWCTLCHRRKLDRERSCCIHMDITYFPILRNQDF